MKSVLSSFDVLRTLRRAKNEYSCIVQEPQSRANLVLRVVKSPALECDYQSLSQFYAWSQTQSHPHLGRVIQAGIGPRQELYWTRHLGELCKVINVDTLIRDLVSGVSFLHANGYLHRHIRPPNVFTFEGRFQLVDARPWERLSLSEASPVDIHFTAPETIRGRPHSEAADLYSLGATLYFFIVGRTLFEDIDLEILKSKYLLAVPQRLQDLNIANDRMAFAIDRMVSRNPANRIEGFKSLRSWINQSDCAASVAPFIGRETELFAILQQKSRTSFTCAVTSVEGAVGIGKTRFLDELSRRSHFYGLDFILGKCSGSDVGLEPVKAALSQLMHAPFRSKEQIREAVEKYCPLVAEFLGTDIASNDITQTSSQILISDLVSLISHLSRTRPIVVAIDDVHWASSATKAFVVQFCLRRRDISGSILLTSISSSPETDWFKQLIDEIHIDNFRMFCLLPLSENDSAKVVSTLGVPIGHTERNQVLTNAGGSPFFLSLLSLKGRTVETQAALWLTSAFGCLEPNALILVRFLSLFDVPVPQKAIQNSIALSDEDFRLALFSALRADLIDQRVGGLSLRHRSSLQRPIYLSIPIRTRLKYHALAFQNLLDTNIPREIVATHAIKGQCYEAAIPICLEAARKFKARDEFVASLEHYRAANKAAVALGKKLPFGDQMQIADCYVRLGRHKQARAMYKMLLDLAAGPDSDPSLKPILYAKLGRPELRATNNQRMQLYSLALRQMPRDAETRVLLYGLIAQTLVRMGKLKQAQAAADKTLSCCPSDAGQLRFTAMATRGLVCLHAGRFQDAIGCFRTIRLTQSTFSMGVMTNCALSLEYMGNLRGAEMWLRRVRELADRTGHAFPQIMSANNLACVLKKQGRFREADVVFARAAERFTYFRSKDATFPADSLSIVKSDLALFHLECGRYALAGRQSRPPVYSEERTPMDNMSMGLSYCEVQLKMGRVLEAERTLVELGKFSLSDSPFFRVEFLLLLVQLKESDLGALRELKALVVGANAVEALHQRCRLFIVLTSSAAANDLAGAKIYAEEAFKIAKKNGYRPLLAQAMMLRGVASGHHREREHWLMQGFKLASEIGMPELVAESAYHIGVHLLKEGHFATGKEYLLKSTAITSELAEQIPTRYRSRYLGKAWRKDGRKRLEECVQRQGTGLPRIQSLSSIPYQENRFFSALYHVSVVASTASGADSFLSELLQALDAAVKRPIVLILAHDDRTAWNSTRVDLTDDLKKQVLTISSKARERAIFDYKDRSRTRGTIAWIPIRSAHYGGGFYVMCREHEIMVEREMEFLTVLGNVTGNALDQIDARSRSTPPPLEKNEFCGIIGKSRVIRELHRQIEIAAGNNATVLIEGETGSGKEVVARAIHKLSSRSAAAFIAVDCGAIPEGLIESELFGSKRGSYTGATTDRPGLFEAANHGTLFLDEISNTNLNVQAKLLRVLQEREVRRVGETRGRAVDVRLIAATNKSLMTLVQDGAFRQDLLYRLNVLHLTIPPLRNRREDIPLLAAHFLDRLNTTQKTNKVFSSTAFDAVLTHEFPGNVRELHNAVERGFFSANGKTISIIPLERAAGDAAIDDVKAWFQDLAAGRKNFWTAIHERYKRRDIPREKIVALVDLGLRATHGSYKDLASLFRVGNKGYRRLMDFLRRNDCLLDFRPYRQNPDAP
jgi:transcriptional regulator with PAS, ATPase and Fis domain/tetratricopeptide (TPR) repeat protein/serine/threonine protein kinase